MLNDKTFQAPAPKRSPLIGKYFYTTKRGRIEHRGQIMEQIDSSHYLVDLLTFTPCMLKYQCVYAVSDMKGWLLYEDMVQMENSLKHGYASLIAP